MHGCWSKICTHKNLKHQEGQRKREIPSPTSTLLTVASHLPYDFLQENNKTPRKMEYQQVVLISNTELTEHSQYLARKKHNKIHVIHCI